MLELFNLEKGRKVNVQLESAFSIGWALTYLLLISIRHKTQRDGFCLQVKIKEELFVVRVVGPLVVKCQGNG